MSGFDGNGGHVEAAAFLGERAALACADGTVRFEDGTVVQAHDGLLAAVATPNGFVTGGEDGRLCLVAPDGEVTERAARDGQWIDRVAAGPGGAVAFAQGRTVTLIDGRGETGEYAVERAAEGLAFFPKGLRLAVAHYGGVSLFYAGNPTPQRLEWPGAHAGVTVSPDGAFVVTTMQEPALHGWRLNPGRHEPHLRMSGYPAKVASLSWSAWGASKSRWLATAGAPSAVCWPFGGKGPQNTTPRQPGFRQNALATRVACHPKAPALAVGYRDGAVVVAPIEDGDAVTPREPVVLREPGGAAISALAWDGAGHRIVFGCEDGQGGVVNVTG